MELTKGYNSDHIKFWIDVIQCGTLPMVSGIALQSRLEHGVRGSGKRIKMEHASPIQSGIANMKGHLNFNVVSSELVLFESFGPHHHHKRGGLRWAGIVAFGAIYLPALSIKHNMAR